MDEWRTLLERERKREALSRQRLAELAQVAVATVKAYETGARHPKRPYLVAILDALERREEALCVDLMRKHLEGVEEAIRRWDPEYHPVG